MTDPKAIDGARAAILYTALDTAISVTRESMKLKASAPFRGALELQLSAYECEKAELKRTFPELNGNAQQTN